MGEVEQSEGEGYILIKNYQITPHPVKLTLARLLPEGEKYLKNELCNKTVNF